MVFTITEILLIVCPFLLIIVGVIARRTFLVILGGMFLALVALGMTWPLWTKILLVFLAIGIVFAAIWGGKSK